MAVLKEMKYLKLRNKEIIPEIPEAVFAKRDMLFKYYSNMMLLSQLYNRLITDALEVEKPLMASALEKIHKQLQGALSNKTWEMEGQRVGGEGSKKGKWAQLCNIGV